MRVIALIIAIILFTWVLAAQIWRFLPVDETAASEQVMPQADASALEVARNAINLQPLLRLHVFGEPIAINVTPTVVAPIVPVVIPAQTNLEETKLNLTLVGLHWFEDSQYSRAIVADSNTQQSVYRVGDTLPSGDAVVTEILQQQLIITYQGRRETLTLFTLLKQQSKPKGQTVEFAKPISQPVLAVEGIKVDLSMNRIVRRQLTAYRDQALMNPMALNGVMNVIPKQENGQFQGYTLSAGTDQVLFRNAGLKDGDVLKSINGVLLDRADKIVELMQLLPTLKDANLTVDRNGEIYNLHYRLN